MTPLLANEAWPHAAHTSVVLCGCISYCEDLQFIGSCVLPIQRTTLA